MPLMFFKRGLSACIPRMEMSWCTVVHNEESTVLYQLLVIERPDDIVFIGILGQFTSKAPSI